MPKQKKEKRWIDEKGKTKQCIKTEIENIDWLELRMIRRNIEGDWLEET